MKNEKFFSPSISSQILLSTIIIFACMLSDHFLYIRVFYTHYFYCFKKKLALFSTYYFATCILNTTPQTCSVPVPKSELLYSF